MKHLEKTNTIQNIIKILKLMKGQVVIYGLTLIAMAGVYGIIMDVYANTIYQKLLDAAFAYNVSEIKNYSIWLLVIMGGACVICPALSYIVHFCIQKVITNVRIMIFEKALKFPMEYYKKTHSEDIISCLNNDLQLLEDFYFWPIFRILLVGMIGIGSAIFLFLYHPFVAIAAISTALITLLINQRYGRAMKVQTDNIQKLQAQIAGVTIDELSSFRVSRMSAMQTFLFGKFSKYNARHLDTKIKYGKQQAGLDVCNNTFNYFGYILVFVLSLYLVFQGQLTIGAAIACMQLRGGIEFMISEIGSIIGQVQFCSSGTERIFHLLEMEEESEYFELMETDKIPSEDVILKFENINFSYSDHHEIYRNANFEIKKGMKVAVVGHSGAGKSTIPQLLLGFYPVKKGMIYFNGHPINYYSKKQIRNMIAYVPQNPYLFYDTIKENIGLNGAEDSEIIQAAEDALIHETIMELPQQYDTMIDENGANLSGGQKQRITIARAFLKKSDIIIFDESTSALERKVESKIIENITDSKINKVIIFITHRKETLEKMDKIFLVKNGEIIQYDKNEYVENYKEY